MTIPVQRAIAGTASASAALTMTTTLAFSSGRWETRLHVVYETQVTNAKPVPATLQESRVLDADDPDRVIATVGADDLADVLRDLTGQAPAGSLTIGPVMV